LRIANCGLDGRHGVEDLEIRNARLRIAERGKGREMGMRGGRGGTWRAGAAAGVVIGVLAAGWLVWAGWGGTPSAATSGDGREGSEMQAATRTEQAAKPPIDEAVPARVETATFALG
jgi:hypothetical protein